MLYAKTKKKIILLFNYDKENQNIEVIRLFQILHS
jgi:hypothetical protein